MQYMNFYLFSFINVVVVVVVGGGGGVVCFLLICFRFCFSSFEKFVRVGFFYFYFCAVVLAL